MTRRLRGHGFHFTPRHTQPRASLGPVGPRAIGNSLSPKHFPPPFLDRARHDRILDIAQINLIGIDPEAKQSASLRAKFCGRFGEVGTGHVLQANTPAG